MKLGARILKTGITLVLAIYICELLGFEPIIYTAIAATLAIQPSVYRSWQYGVEQVQSNLVGATIAILFTAFIGNSPIFMAIAVMLAIGINLKLNFERTITLSIVTVLSIMEGGAQEPNILLFALDRFLLIFIGVFSAILVNAFLYPPKYDRQLSTKLTDIEEKMGSILRIILDNNKNEKYIRTSISELEKEIDNSWNLLTFEEEAKIGFKKKLPFSASRKLVIYKSMLETAELGIQMFGMIEKYQNTIHQDFEEINKLFQKQLNDLANYQDRIYSKFEGKIHSTHEYQQDTVFDDASLSIYEVIDTIDKSNLKLDVLSILLIIREYNKSLSHLDRLVNIYHTHHSK